MDFLPYQEPPAEVRSSEVAAPCAVVDAAIGGAVSPMPWRSSSASLRRAPESIVRGLRQVFVFRDYNRVERMAEENPQLVPLLVEAHQQVARVFGPDAPLVLEVVVNPESAESLPEMFLYIQTRLSVPEARAKLEQLDEEWWLDALPRAAGRLNIALEYA